ncbi:hypothetical protein PLEOSDRAFT_158167 [Pleurotus ostreatus PC15]|uniref:Distal membrane-arm assembly complex protein 1-like domain-containing protein n=1 Tax=Pleurotus ostreatus (strain PC15) TaxID=1137138 RepID=A0A067NWF8_PLEO1|nr:hypothetical protein PLEOSDRAFT_158167 [Pleurotus ostreatus PC15]
MSSTTNEDSPKPVRPSQSLTEHIHAMPGSKDCLSCRIVGTGTFAGVGTYALYQARPAALGSPMQKRLVAGLGVCGGNSFEHAIVCLIPLLKTRPMHSHLAHTKAYHIDVGHAFLVNSYAICIAKTAWSDGLTITLLTPRL